MNHIFQLPNNLRHTSFYHLPCLYLHTIELLKKPNIMTKIKLTFISLCFPLLMMSQTDSTAVKSIEGITDKMLEIISGEIDEPRDWDEFRNLFLPTAQLFFIRPGAPAGKQIMPLTVEDFITKVGPLYARDGFEEYKIGLEIDEFNGIANVFQSYYCRNLKGTYEERGINSYQLIYADDRWWISSSTFANETEEHPIPEEYLDVKDKE